MYRLLLPVVPAAVIGLVAHGSGFKLPDAILIAIGVWSIFVVFRRLMSVTTVLVIVCVVGALSQVDWYGQQSAGYAASLEASPGTFTHLARTVYRSVVDAVGIPHAPFSEAHAESVRVSASGGAPLAVPDAAAATPDIVLATTAPVTVVSVPSLSAIPVSAASSVYSGPSTITVAGQPRIVDAATLAVNGRLVHLEGVSVPAGATGCWRNGRSANCGVMATERLRQLVGPSRVSCIGTPQASAIQARCNTPMVDDLAKAMLDEGWAVLSRDAGPTYQEVASTARGNRRGLWAANFARADQLEPTSTTLRR